MQAALGALGVKPAELEMATRIMDALCTLNGNQTNAAVIQAISTSAYMPVRTGDVKLLLSRRSDCVRITRTDRSELFACTYADLREAAARALLARKEGIMARAPQLADRAAVSATLSRASVGDARQRDTLMRALAELDDIERQSEEVKALDQFVFAQPPT
jgi:hypothetical protein